MTFHTFHDLLALSTQALHPAGASLAQAAPTALARVSAEAQGLASHGLSRVPTYASHLRTGRVQGQRTTDPARGLEASMLLMGGTKGAMLALMVELLVTSLTGANFGAEADSFFLSRRATSPGWARCSMSSTPARWHRFKRWPALPRGHEVSLRVFVNLTWKRTLPCP